MQWEFKKQGYIDSARETYLSAARTLADELDRTRKVLKNPVIKTACAELIPEIKKELALYVQKLPPMNMKLRLFSSSSSISTHKRTETPEPHSSLAAHSWWRPNLEKGEKLVKHLLGSNKP